MRTNMEKFGKRNPLTEKHFAAFEQAYTAEDRKAIKDERWSSIARAEIAKKGDSLDLGLIADENLVNYEDLPEPQELAKQAIGELKGAVKDLEAVLKIFE